jgi:cyclopropane-fatty-acyl-phospholipid synthase
MSLIGRMIDKLLAKGSITLIEPGKEPQTYGPGGGRHITARFTDRNVAIDKNKKTPHGICETDMDGRVVN